MRFGSIGSRLGGLSLWAFASIGMGAAAQAAPVSVAGVYRATAEIAGVDIPFRLAISGDGDHLHANFFDGDRPTTPSTGGQIDGDHVHILFASYAATLDATLNGDRLDGVYVYGTHTVPFHAVKDQGPPPAPAPAPSIGGEWIVPTNSSKGESAWRLIVHQDGDKVDAAILRIDGDTGTLNGRYKDGAFHLSHFAGERPALLDVTPQPDGTLKLRLFDGDDLALTALRSDAAAKLGVAPDDPTHHTTVRDPAAPFAFAFPDLAGHVVRNTDPRFRGKVVVADIMGSWCPNCHDEAPFLQSLYAKYHAKGLEIVALDFEPGVQLTDPQRLRAFIERYGLTYTVLLAGEPKELHQKLPDAVNLNAWPTTFFIGRDGHVRATHVGFTSPGSGPLDIETKHDVEHLVQTLLAEPAP
jgi:thiol-disulfide isomerase/thioredoxin